MVKMFKIIIIIIIIVFILSLFDDKEKSELVKGDSKYDFDYSWYNPIEQWNRLIGIDVNEVNDNYIESFEYATKLGMNFTTMSFNWDDIESNKGKYFNENLEIANSYYPLQNIKIALVISVIDTTANSLPEYLKWKKFNDKEVIESFKNMLDFTFSEIKDLDLLSISIWNEVDIYLWNDKGKWKEYEEFFKEISIYIKKKYPDLKVWAKITLDWMLNKNLEESKSLNRYSDVIMVTYYPLNSNFEVKITLEIKKDLEDTMNLYQKNFQFLELWCPSWYLVKSSQAKQAEFIHNMFLYWDKYKNRIESMNIIWINERSKSELKGYTEYYWINDKKFVDYLGTLGLFDSAWNEKNVVDILKKELEYRKWK